MGGYNVPPLVEALKVAEVADAAAKELKIQFLFTTHLMM